MLVKTQKTVVKNKSFGILLLSGIIALGANAQKSKVLSAYNLQQAFYASKDCSELEKARDAIELALTHEKSAEWAKTWFYRGNIYFDIHISEDPQCQKLSDDALNVTYDSYMKAMGYDEKEQFKDDIEPKLSVVASLYTQSGAQNYNVKNYESALSDFEKALEVAKYFSKTDTTALYNAALTSEKLKNYGKAALYYEGLIDIGYKDPRVYHFLSEAYINSGDSARAFQAITLGRKAHPTNQDLIIDELNYYLQRDQHQLALENLQLAISQMGDNAELHFAKGTIHDKIGETDAALEEYQKAIDLKPDYFDAIYNTGALYFNIGVEYVDKAGSFDETQQKQFKEAEAKSEESFQKALPYLEKANELNPHDRSTLISLKNLYSRTGDEEGYKRVSEILDN